MTVKELKAALKDVPDDVNVTVFKKDILSSYRLLQEFIPHLLKYSEETKACGARYKSNKRQPSKSKFMISC